MRTMGWGRNLGRAVLAALLILAASPAWAETALPADVEARILAIARLPHAPAISSAVIELIAKYPDLVYPIVLRAARAAPAYSARMAGDAAQAFPGFAREIAEAAGTATPEQANAIVELASASGGVTARSLRESMDNNPTIGTREGSPWRISLGLGVGWAPKYEGAKDYEITALPVVDVTWRDTIFVRADGGLTSTVTGLGPTGVGVNLLRSPNWRIGGRMTLDYGRSNGLDSLLTGTRDVDPDAEIGAFIEYYGGNWNFGGDLRHGLGLASNSHGGYLMEAHGAYGLRLSRSENVVVGLTTTYAGTAYMSTYFDAPGFEAASGFRDVGAYFVFQRYFTPHVFGRVQIRAKRLLEDAAASPVSDADSNNQFLLGAQAGYTF